MSITRVGEKKKKKDKEKKDNNKSGQRFIITAIETDKVL